ncbi:hypothetical protein [Archangium lansingense]|uniref:DUF4845 domain-containing protein n=1 Tax=Archangium lansingense TaxID=2995310 RepID=A0ABT4AAJ3_9BACT|nr:hypothetical protein [Archangium lansinium]MCY1078640.1 hypothetical protein [Archangium lansinium]
MRHPSGKISLGGLVLLTLIVGGIYVGVMVVPFYVDNLDVKEAVAAAHNRAAQGAPDDSLRNTIIERTSDLGTHWERDQFDRDILVPGLGLTPEQISIERSDVTGKVRIEVEYSRRVRFKPTSHVRTLKFRVVQDGIPGQ